MSINQVLERGAASCINQSPDGDCQLKGGCVAESTYRDIVRGTNNRESLKRHGFFCFVLFEVNKEVKCLGKEDYLGGGAGNYEGEALRKVAIVMSYT